MYSAGPRKLAVFLSALTACLIHGAAIAQTAAPPKPEIPAKPAPPKAAPPEAAQTPAPKAKAPDSAAPESKAPTPKPEEAKPAADGPDEKPTAPAGPPESSEPDEPEAGEPEQKQPEAKADKAPEADEPPLQPAVPWNDKIKEVAAKRYPAGVEDLRVLQDQVQAVVRHARPAVVGIQLGNSVGSGVVVNAEGLVLTAGHVAGRPGTKAIFRFADGSRARGVSLGINRSIDSGMMQITDDGPFPYLKVGKGGELENGEWVIGLGHPNGYTRDRAPPVRLGRVLYENDNVVNTDCTLVGGDSGGPLVNLHGEVVGIHSRIGRRITSNFHVPISTYESTWDRLLAGELWGGGIGGSEQARFRPMLGVMGNPRNTPCRITQVAPGMPAARAGIKVGDVVTKLDGKDIETFSDLAGIILRKQPGSKVKLAIQRGEETLELDIRLTRGGLDYPGAPPMPERENG